MSGVRTAGFRRRRYAPLVAVFVVAVVLGAGSSAFGMSAPIQIANTGGEGVFIRSEPNTSSARLGWMAEGTSPDYHCFVWGQNINGVPIWFYVTHSGVTGYYASYYDNSSYHSNEELTAKYGVPLCGASEPQPPPTPQPPPVEPGPPPSGGQHASALVFGIVNAEGGIYYRRSPHWGDTAAAPGIGVYDGDQVELQCGALGDPVGPYNDAAWSKVRDLTRPGIGEGWVNEHFINDGAASGSFPPGEPTCQGGGSSGGGGSGPSPAPVRSSVFFSPNETSGGLPGVGVADHELTLKAWTSPTTQCDPARAAAAVAGFGNVDTLAGWSKGRLGPIYVLAASKSLRGVVHRIVLFDPGSTADFTSSLIHGHACDENFNINALLALWVGSNPANQLLVLTGKDSEERTGGDVGRETFHGLWTYYFAGIWNQPFASQVQVCDYPNLDHEAVLKEFAWVVNTPTHFCPSAPWLPQPIAWNP